MRKLAVVAIIVATIGWAMSVAAQTQTLTPGWNMVGNTLPNDVNPAIFPEAIVETAWTWDNTSTPQVWKFYSTQMGAAELSAYTATKGFETLHVINPGEGVWINAKMPVELTELLTGDITTCPAPSLPRMWAGANVCVYPQQTKVPLTGTLPDSCTDFGQCFKDAMKNGAVKVVEVSQTIWFAFFRTANAWHIIPMNTGGSFMNEPSMTAGSATTEIIWVAGVDGSLQLSLGCDTCWMYEYTPQSGIWSTSDTLVPCIP